MNKVNDKVDTWLDLLTVQSQFSVFNSITESKILSLLANIILVTISALMYIWLKFNLNITSK